MSTQNDFMAVETHLVARLRAELAGQTPAVHVLTAAELAQVQESRQLTPAVHVVYGGFRVQETRRDGATSRLQHTWLIVAADKNVAGIREGAAARAAAGALMAKAGAALMGFRPPDVAGPLLLAPAPRPQYANGFQFLPLAFTVETYFTRSTTD